MGQSPAIKVPLLPTTVSCLIKEVIDRFAWFLTENRLNRCPISSGTGCQVACLSTHLVQAAPGENKPTNLLSIMTAFLTIL